MRNILLMATCLFFHNAWGQDTTHVTLHFLYGSKPAKCYQGTEKKWFGGKWGGHVGIEIGEDEILNFVRQGKFHWLGKRKDKHGKFTLHTKEGFWQIFGGNVDSVKRLSIIIPISGAQKTKLDSIQKVYLNEPPYDYALVGMRCGAAAYEILGQIGIVQPYSRRRTMCKIAYPRKLRKKMLRKANEHQWRVVRQEGTVRRNWEGD